MRTKTIPTIPTQLFKPIVMYKFTKQTSKEVSWNDESGTSIPYNRTTKVERLRESKAFMLANKATALHEELKEFKGIMQQACDDVVEAIRAEHKIKTDSKGNFTWYNFDHSVKIEVNVNDMIRFDETLIDAAKEKLMHLIDRNLTGDDFIKSIVAEAFQTSTGKLDTRRILQPQSRPGELGHCSNRDAFL